MSSRTDLTKMGKHIFDLRKGLGYTQKQLGEMLDVSDKTVSKWEQGDVAPDITILTSLASALKVSVNEILYGEKEEQKENEDEKSISVLNLYTKQTKSSLIRKIVLFIFIILVVATFLFYIEDYYKWKVSYIAVDDKFNIEGFIVSNFEETKIVINKISFVSKAEEELLVKEIDTKLYYNGEKIYNKTTELDKPTYVSDSFNNYEIFLEKEMKISKDGLKLFICFTDCDGVKHSYSFEF